MGDPTGRCLALRGQVVTLWLHSQSRVPTLTSEWRPASLVALLTDGEEQTSLWLADVPLHAC